MEPLKDPREKYWDQTYTNYWLNRVEESHGEGLSNVLEGDVKTEGEWVYEEIFYKNKSFIDTEISRIELENLL